MDFVPPEVSFCRTENAHKHPEEVGDGLVDSAVGTPVPNIDLNTDVMETENLETPDPVSIRALLEAYIESFPAPTGSSKLNHIFGGDRMLI